MRPCLEPQGMGRPGVADAALEERSHDRDDTRVHGGEAGVVQVDARNRRGGAATGSCGRRSERPCHSSRSPGVRDRKSTRLNSSHSQISYAVFCLKKKKNTKNVSV